MKDIVTNIECMDKTVNFEQNIGIFLIKLKKKDNEIYKQESNDETKKILFNSLKEGLIQSRFINRDVVPYDPVVNKKNTHELVTVSNFQNITKILDKFNDENQHLINTNGMNESKFHLYMVTLSCKEHNYKIFGSFSNVLALQKKYILGQFISKGNFTDSTIEFKDTNNTFGFSKKIDLLVIDDVYILINQAESKFESVFKMNELFSMQAKDIIDNNKKIRQVFSNETRGKLAKKVGSGKRMASRLIKITSDEKRFNETIDNIAKIQEIVSDKENKFYSKVKDVKFENGQLSVKEGQKIQLLNAISDAPYHADISQMENVDGSRT
ncbi:hypothetical protein [Lentilactobacillus parakefiri]|uniref:hypothetical protein n=1 Tax=Lentilactobacillus parakefiri TaxID=152332 RepID=UPI00117B5950|nr:hypothetical protein [Lentilactobacillus parakefiri]